MQINSIKTPLHPCHRNDCHNLAIWEAILKINDAVTITIILCPDCVMLPDSELIEEILHRKYTAEAIND